MVDFKYLGDWVKYYVKVCIWGLRLIWNWVYWTLLQFTSWALRGSLIELWLSDQDHKHQQNELLAKWNTGTDIPPNYQPLEDLKLTECRAAFNAAQRDLDIAIARRSSLMDRASATGTMTTLLLATVALLVPFILKVPSRPGATVIYFYGPLIALRVLYWVMGIIAVWCFSVSALLCIRFLEPVEVYHIGFPDIFKPPTQPTTKQAEIIKIDQQDCGLLERLLSRLRSSLTILLTGDNSKSRVEDWNSEAEKDRLRSAIVQMLWATEINELGSRRKSNRLDCAHQHLYDAVWCIAVLMLASAAPQICEWLMNVCVGTQ